MNLEESHAENRLRSRVHWQEEDERKKRRVLKSQEGTGGEQSIKSTEFSMTINNHIRERHAKNTSDALDLLYKFFLFFFPTSLPPSLPLASPLMDMLSVEM
jgi:hypothetical protein